MKVSVLVNICVLMIYGCTSLTYAGINKNLMLLSRDSGHTFRSLWDSSTPFNDPLNEKADVTSPNQLYMGGDFRTAIDPAWGNLEYIVLDSYNALNDQLFTAYLDITGKNMSDIDDWLQNTPVIYTEPFDALDSPKMVINSQEEVLLQDTSYETWFSTRHGFGANPIIMMPINTSSSFSVSEGVTDGGDCLPDWSFTMGASYVDEVNLNPQHCLTFCVPQVAAMQSGNTCNCADYSIPSTSLPHMCTLPCPGDSNFICGGINTAYFTMYTGTPPIDERVGLTTPNSDPLFVAFHANATSHVINVATDVNQIDDLLYIDRISVLAYNFSDEQPILFGFDYSYNLTDDDFEYRLNGNQWWYTDGITVNITTLPVKKIVVWYEYEVINATITLYGPTNISFVELDYIIVSGVFTVPTTTSTGPSTTSTTAVTTTTTTATTTTTTPATTAASTTTPSTTTAGTTTTSAGQTTTSSCSSTTVSPFMTYPNNSILFNGTLYCPCGNTTTGNNTNSTYDFPQMLADLLIDPDTLAAEERRYTSATDNRPSAISIGALAICVIVGVVGTIVYLDSSRLAAEALKCKKNAKKAKQKMSTNRVDSISSSVHGSVDIEELDIPDILK